MDRELFAKQFDISGRIYFIPGGGGGLGSETGCALAAIGANVVVLNHRPSRAVRIKERIQCGPGRTQVLYGDVLDPASLEKAREAICVEFSRIDGTINAAGGNHPQAITRSDLPFFDLSPSVFRQVVDLNLLGAVFSCQVFGRVLAEQAEGVIINFSSMNTYRPLTRVPAYSAGKAALTNLT